MPEFELSGHAPTALAPSEPSPQEIALIEKHQSSLQQLQHMKEEIKEREAAYEKAEAELIAAFDTFGVIGVMAECGIFTLVRGNKKVFGDSVSILEEELKLEKKEAEKRGEVTLVPTKPYIKITK